MVTDKTDVKESPRAPEATRAPEAAVSEAIPAVGVRPDMPALPATTQDDFARKGFARADIDDKGITFHAADKPPLLAGGTDAAPPDKRVAELRGGADVAPPDTRAAEIEKRFPIVLGRMPAEERQALISGVVKDADRLQTVSPQEGSAAYREMLDKTMKEHPSLDPKEVTTMYRAALAFTPGNNVEAWDKGPVSVLRAQRAVSPDNPEGILATAFVPDSKNSSLESLDRKGFAAAQDINSVEAAATKAVPPDQRDAMLAQKGALDREFLKAGLMETPKDVAPRTPGATAPGVEQQTAGLVDKFKGTLSAQPEPLQVAQDVVAKANAAAFANPKDQAAVLTAGYNELLAKNPDLQPAMAAAMLASAMNTATGTRDFGLQSKSDPPVTTFTDKRLRTDGNPDGSFAMVVNTREDAAMNSVALQAARDTARIVRDQAAGPPAESAKFVYQISHSIIAGVYGRDN